MPVKFLITLLVGFVFPACRRLGYEAFDSMVRTKHNMFIVGEPGGEPGSCFFYSVEYILKKMMEKEITNSSKQYLTPRTKEVLQMNGYSAHALRALAVKYLGSPEGRSIHEGSTIEPYDEYLVKAAQASTCADSVLIAGLATELVVKVDILKFVFYTTTSLKLFPLLTQQPFYSRLSSIQSPTDRRSSRRRECPGRCRSALTEGMAHSLPGY